MCVRVCQCNHCLKHRTCMDCKYQNGIKKIDCLKNGIQGCFYFVNSFQIRQGEKK